MHADTLWCTESFLSTLALSEERGARIYDNHVLTLSSSLITVLTPCMHATPKGTLMPWHCFLLTKGLHAKCCINSAETFPRNFTWFVMGLEQWNQIQHHTNVSWHWLLDLRCDSILSTWFFFLQEPLNWNILDYLYSIRVSRK